MPNAPVNGRSTIVQMFREEFAAAPEMHCIPVQIISEEARAALEWRHPKGFCGCGFFQVLDGKIQTQRGYWDKLSFQKLYGL